MDNIVIFVILTSWLLDAFKDAIAFGNSQRWMKELWHMVKFVSYIGPYALLVYLSDLPCLWYFYLCLLGYIIHEGGYPVFRALNVWEWDRRLKIKIVRILWLISNNGR